MTGRSLLSGLFRYPGAFWKVWRDLRTAWLMIADAIGNRTRRRRIVSEDEDAPVISLTSYGKRIETAYFTVESLARGKVLPSRLILWIGDNESESIPSSLMRLQKRGLEIIRTKDYRSHKKYYPFAVSAKSHQTALVTVDDDTIYPVTLLQTLIRFHEAAPDYIIANRARRLILSEGAIAPYESWPAASPHIVSSANFAVGVGGVLYPPAVVDGLREAGTDFLEVAPRADDIWLHKQALTLGSRVILTGEYAEDDFLGIRGIGGQTSLWSLNVVEGGNDAQIAATYGSADLRVLEADVARSREDVWTVGR